MCSAYCRELSVALIDCFPVTPHSVNLSIVSSLIWRVVPLIGLSFSYQGCHVDLVLVPCMGTAGKRTQHHIAFTVYVWIREKTVILLMCFVLLQ